MTALWDWALEAYARPGVEALCIDLQDLHQQSVPYLLWAAWVAADGGVPAPSVLMQAVGIARAWEGEVVAPLRQVRRRLRSAGVERLREQVSAAELAAERALMDALEALTVLPAERDDPDNGLEHALAAAGRTWAPAADPVALKLLATLLR